MDYVLINGEHEGTTISLTEEEARIYIANGWVSDSAFDGAVIKKKIEKIKRKDKGDNPNK